MRRIYDNTNIQLFITGSSSKLLTSEIATSLRGRTISFEIFPFSFKEYLSFRKILSQYLDLIVYYFKEKQDVDFYARIDSSELLINVSYDISDATREISGLLEGMQYFNLGESFLITKNEEKDVGIEGKVIHIRPLYEFLLIESCVQ